MYRVHDKVFCFAAFVNGHDVTCALLPGDSANATVEPSEVNAFVYCGLDKKADVISNCVLWQVSAYVDFSTLSSCFLEYVTRLSSRTAFSVYHFVNWNSGEFKKVLLCAGEWFCKNYDVSSRSAWTILLRPVLFPHRTGYDLTYPTECYNIHCLEDFH